MIHFEYYPSVEYSDNVAKNIMVRGKIRDVVLKNSSLYYKYTIEDHLKPEIISHKYYGSPSYVWAIYYANNIFDPINDWVRTPKEMEEYIKQKYGTIEGASREYNFDGSINWDNIHHFIEVDEIDKNTYIIDRKTFEKKRFEGNKTVKAVTFYEHENQLNEKKRNIIILDKGILMQLVGELRNLFSES